MFFRFQRRLLWFLPLTFLTWGAWQMRPFNPAREFDVKPLPTPLYNAANEYPRVMELLQGPFIYGSRPVAAILDTSANVDVSAKENPTTYPLARKKAWLQARREGLNAFERAQKMPFVFIQPDPQTSDGQLATPIHFAWIARYKTVEAQVYALEGRHEAAVDVALELYQMALRSQKGAHLTATLSTLSAEIYARYLLNNEIAHLNSEQAAHAAKRLEKIVQMRPSWKQTLESERTAQLLNFKAALERQIYQEQQLARNLEAIDNGATSTSFDTGKPPEINTPFFNFRARRMAQQQDAVFRSLIQTADAPWPLRVQLPTPPSEAPPLEKLKSAITRSRFAVERSRAHSHLILTRLALHAYRKKQGFYPSSLSQLAPQYLSTVPLDPFSQGAPLRYRTKGSRYVLWSVGPDTRDDNAKPAETLTPARPWQRFSVKEDSIGDIVANVHK